MRYDNWDIILFPEDSNIPIPEYKTACYFSRDEDGRELATLRTYIGSLKPETPFRVSVHHWGPPKPSPFLQQAQRRAGSDITFTVQVIIDGARLYHGSFAVDTSLPHEIAYEQRSLRPSSQSKEQPSSQPKPRLLFPRSDNNTLLRNSAWQPRGTDNRIKIILSERLIDEKSSPNGDCWDIVCFSFQHAPRELLEQAGIAYPITDPLRSLIGQRATNAPQPIPRNTIARGLQRASRIHTVYSPESDFEPIRPANSEPHQQSSTRMPSIAIYPPQFIGHRDGGIPSAWQDSYRSLVDNDMSMGLWPSQRYASNMAGVEGLCNPSYPPYTAHPWSHGTAAPGSRTGPNVNDSRRRKDSNSQQVMMSLRDDQFGQIVEAISPSKKQRGKPNGLPPHSQRTQQSSTQSHRPPKMGALSVPVRPASAVSRSAACSDSGAASWNSIKRPLSDQASLRTKPLFKTKLQHMDKKENHGSTGLMPNPFTREAERWGSDISMRDGSSNFSSLSGFERDSASLGSKVGSAHAPRTGGEIKGRKEGLAIEASEYLEISVHHGQSLLSTLDADSSGRTRSNGDDAHGDAQGDAQNRPTQEEDPVPSLVEVIDVDAIDPILVAETTADLAKLSPFKPAHKAGMSSISSTGRLERQLYSALGEELGSFEQRMHAADMGPELAQALAGMDTHRLDSPVGESEPIFKRKRQGTLGGERDPSPTKKKEKARQAMVEDADMPRLRGN